MYQLPLENELSIIVAAPSPRGGPSSCGNQSVFNKAQVSKGSEALSLSVLQLYSASSHSNHSMGKWALEEESTSVLCRVEKGSRALEEVSPSKKHRSFLVDVVGFIIEFRAIKLLLGAP